MSGSQSGWGPIREAKVGTWNKLKQVYKQMELCTHLRNTIRTMWEEHNEQCLL